MKRVLVVLVFLLLVSAGLAFAGGQEEAEAPGQEEEEQVEILWWSHWASEPAKVEVIERIASDYEREHPNVSIEVVWWDKKPLQEAWKTAMTAGGRDIPDIVTDPAAESLAQIQAGWFLPLGDEFPWQNYKPGSKDNAQYGNVDGYFKYNIGLGLNMILYNKEIFAEAGIEVPDDYTFTAEEWVEITSKVNELGYAGCALAIGDRPYPGTFPIFDALFSKVGAEETYQYINGLQSWDTEDAREVLDWSVELREAGFWPETYSTMGINEFHLYFHTQEKAATLWIPSWYTGRAFKSVDEGGQPRDFQFGMLRYPEWPNGEAHDKVVASFESGYMISAETEHPEVARDVLTFAAQPKYGALWELTTNIPSAIKYTSEDIPSDAPETEFGWYHETINEVYGPLDIVTMNFIVPEARCGEFLDATTTVINEGLPLGLIDVDEAVQRLDSGLCE